MSKRTARMMEEGSSSRHNLSGGSRRSSVGSTRSLRSGDLGTVLENGREYPNDTYFMPCDAQEQTRLAILHRVFLNALGGELTSAPLPTSVERILDVGSGPGDWAIAMALEHPEAEVVAVDLAVWDVEAAEDDARRRLDEQGLSEIELPHVTWEIGDLDIWGPTEHVEATVEEGTEEEKGEEEGEEGEEEGEEEEEEELTRSVRDLHMYDVGRRRANPQISNRSSRRQSLRKSFASSSCRAPTNLGWSFTEPFDLIHIRGMKGAFADWTGVYKESYENLVPGGWLEVVELQYHIAKADSRMRHVFINFHDVASKSGYPVTTTHLQREFFEAVGFEDYEMINVDVPLGSWPGDDESQTLKNMHLICLIESIDASGLRLFTRQSSLKKEEVEHQLEEVVQELLAGAHEEMETSFRFVKARRPLEKSV